jgi:adenylate kinase
MNLVLLGAPGAGKGTQAERIKQKTGMYVLSTGNLLREKAREDTESGREIARLLRSGVLLSDETVIELVKEKLNSEECKNGVIFDGFPRTDEQAKVLDTLADITAAVALTVSDDEIAERMIHRRTCPNCQSTYHLKSMPPVKKGVCDKCGTGLVRRLDDNPKTVRKRLQVYHKQTEPVIRYYQEQNRLITINGAEDPETVFEKLMQQLEAGNDNH